MKKYLLPTKNCYKANLHCHTTVSDGAFTPEELKEAYKSQGYQIVAFTDHEVLVPHTELCDGEFLALTGYEAHVYGDDKLPKRLCKLTHLNLYPKNPEQRKMPFFNMKDFLRLDKQPDIANAVYDGTGEDKKVYSAEGVLELIKTAHDCGFIVSYNHPTWSKDDASLYTGLDGLFAMEIYNHGSNLMGHDAYCPYVYEEMLRAGIHLGALATDDTHHREDMFGGVTYVYADTLTHEAVISALDSGDFYASRGPIIKELWYEDGVFHIECSPAKQIVVSNSGRRDPKISVKRAESGYITSADFPICELDHFVRFTVTDADGMTANTRGYWREELESSDATVAFEKRRV